MRGILFVCAIFVALNSSSQEPVNWEFSFDNEFDNLTMKATLDEGWYLYSQSINEDIGPVPTAFQFIANESYQIIGNTIEPESLTKYDSNFNSELNFFEKEVVFEQKIENVDAEFVSGSVTYMVCNGMMCLPPTDLEFIIQLNKQ
jgi:thiol:disulfide interchange protein DsbD